MTQTIAQRIRTDIESEYRRSHAEQAAAKRDGITTPNRASRSGRTRIWCVTPDVVVYCYIDRTNTNRYREVAL